VLAPFFAGAGVVFTNLVVFESTNGSGPAGLVLANDGNFYGTTQGGGTNGVGSVFKLTPSGALTTLHNFAGPDGGGPSAALVQGVDGSLYGTTANGGTNSQGNVFRITTNGALVSLYSFTGGNDGANPSAKLVQGSDGYLYSTTENGGSNEVGTVFKIGTNGGLTSLYSFTGGNDGEYPYGDLAPGAGGSFYGTTVAGSTNEDGTVFQITSSGRLVTLHAFTFDEGYGPMSGLVDGGNGNFYGTTAGSMDSGGTFFVMTPAGALTVLHKFDILYGVDSPRADVIRGNDGNFYGTSFYGCANLAGGVFQITPAGTETVLHAFTNGVDGASPWGAALVPGNDGNLYGVVPGGNASSFGSVFRLSGVVSSAPHIVAVARTNGAFNLTWTSVEGSNYQLQCNSALRSTNWMNLGNVTTATGTTLGATDPLTNGISRFYRVALLP
jgi:uncharacterized repeat protein (TIGR03803 family)